MWKNFFAKIFDTVQIFIIALAIVIPIRYFLFQPFFVSGASMEPNFKSGEYLLIDEISYRFREPERGEVIVFKYPKDKTSFYIKRIIGLPGEAIEIKEGKIKIYNLERPGGEILDEKYIVETTSGFFKISLNRDEYFVLGDNRDHSSDSRNFGPVPRKNIIGRAWLGAFPSSGIQLLESPTY